MEITSKKMALDNWPVLTCPIFNILASVFIHYDLDWNNIGVNVVRELANANWPSLSHLDLRIYSLLSRCQLDWRYWDSGISRC